MNQETIPESSQKKQNLNIVFTPLPPLSWEPGQARESAQKLQEYVSSEAQSAIEWYLDKKQAKKYWAQRLRVLAILATAVAGLIPILAQIYTDSGVPKIPPAWASVFLVVAVTAVGLDRFFGYSSAWMRFLTTEMQIRHALHRFLLDWELHRAKLANKGPDQENKDLDKENQDPSRESKDPSPETIQALIQCCREFISQTNTVLKDEMDEWVREFRLSLAEIDKAAKAQAEVMKLGALNVKVSNGSQCDKGWELSIDDGVPSTRKGKTAAVRGLMPGPHTLSVTGIIDGKAKQAEAAIIVVGGRAEEVSLTLA